MTELFYSSAPRNPEELQEKIKAALESPEGSSYSREDWFKYFERQLRIRYYFEKIRSEWGLTEAIIEKASLAFEPIGEAKAGFKAIDNKIEITELNAKNLEILKKQSNFLDIFEPDTYIKFIDNFILRDIEPGFLLSDSSNNSDTVYIILSGTATFSFKDGNTAAEISCGHFVGNIACILGVDDFQDYTPHRLVVAKTPMKVLAASSNQILNFVKNHTGQKFSHAPFRDLHMKMEAVANEIMFG